jgi:pilus assembly protein CpaB
MTFFSWLTSRWPRIRGHPATFIRRILAAVLFLTAGVLAVRPAAAQSDSGSPVIVSARDIAAGSVLRPVDIRVARLPASARPAGALSTIESADGRILAGAARSGEPLTDARLVGRAAGILGPDDSQRSIVPVRLADAGVAILLHPGERVDVVTTAAGGSRQLLAEMAEVVTVVTRDAEAARGVGRDEGSLVLLELPSDSAAQVAAVSLDRPVTVTLR